MAAQSPRLLLSDDHAMLVEGLRRLLEPEFTIVESVADGKSAVEAYARLQPDLLLMDVGLPVLNGIEAARQIKRASPNARILFITMHTERIYVEEALRVGACGYLVKQAAARELVDAIRTVLRGRRYLSPQIASLLTEEPDGWAGGLTRRQKDVLQLISAGKRMKEIADLLGISVRTVEFHKNGIMEHLGFRTTAELMRYSIEQNLGARSGGEGGIRTPGTR